MRVTYRTDYDPDNEPEYLGAYSEPFPAESDEQRIVAVDWSVPGLVTVTWLTNRYV